MISPSFSVQSQRKPETFVELLRARAESQAEKNAYTFLVDGEIEEATLSYAELDQHARAIGALLQSLNASRQPVLLVYPPGLDYIAAFFGCLYGGAIAVPVYPPTSRRSLPRLAAIVKDARPQVALTTSQIVKDLEQTSRLSELKTLKWVTTDNLDRDLSRQWQDADLTGESLALLQYTSGSTAAPKGVMVSHDNLLQNERMIQMAFGQSEKSGMYCNPYIAARDVF
jgi:acyl-CoA synthetase (AMP-forming)/AMP-acid ligase II